MGNRFQRNTIPVIPPKKRGRPVNTKSDDANEKVFLQLKEKEANDELVTIKELFQYMETLSPEDHDSLKHLKKNF